MTKVLKLKSGEKVSASGVYDLDIELYHGDCCVGPSISSSGLRTIERQTPAHYFAGSYLNPDREPEEASRALDMGRACHTLLLGESGFREQFAVRPDQWSDWRTAAAKEWREEQISAGRTVLVPDDLTHIRGMARTLGAHPLVQAGILQGEVERSLIWKDEETGVWLKSRPDVLPVSDGCVVDLKTCADASPEAVQRAILSHGYAMQGALTRRALKQVLKIDMTMFVLVFVEKAPPYAVSVVEVDQDWIYFAGRQVQRAITTFARCVETGEWPGYADERRVLMPDWLRRQMEADAQAGSLPEETAA